MKVLLTGGTGYVGSRLRDYIKKEGHEVRLLVRRGSEHKIPSTGTFEIERGDIFDTNACLRACEGCDAVVHLIGIIREYPSRGIVFDEAHRVATANIVDAAGRMGVERFVHMSALGASEDAASLYHRTKFAGEQEVQRSSLRWTIFRPAWVFSPGDQLTQTFVDLIHRPVTPLINGGTALMQPIALEDVCTCMARSLAMPETQSQIFELGGPDRIAFREIVQKLATNLGEKLRTMVVPAWAVRPVVMSFQRFASFPLTLDQLRMLLEDNVCEIDRFVKAFQLEPKSFVKALPTLVK